MPRDQRAHVAVRKPFVLQESHQVVGIPNELIANAVDAPRGLEVGALASFVERRHNLLAFGQERVGRRFAFGK
jgi:hypothetical protein